MDLRLGCVVVMCGLGCRDDDALERLPAPRPEIEIASPRPAPPPPPPTEPVPVVHFAGPPEELMPVLTQNGDPIVRMFHLSERAAEDAFLGYGVVGRTRLEDREARNLVERLSGDNAFVDGGEYACVGDPIGLRVERGTDARDVVVDCGRMYFTPMRHAGRYELLAPELNDLIYSLR